MTRANIYLVMTTMGDNISILGKNVPNLPVRVTRFSVSHAMTYYVVRKSHV